MKPACGNCRFWEEDAFSAEHGGTLGECRRYAPRAQSNHILSWPRALKDHWCGEFEQRVTERPQPEGASEK